MGTPVIDSYTFLTCESSCFAKPRLVALMNCCKAVDAKGMGACNRLASA